MKKFNKLLCMVLALTVLCSALPTALAVDGGVKAQREANPNWHTWYNYIHEKVNWYRNVDELRALGDWTLTETDFNGKGFNFKSQHRDTAPDGLAAATVSGCDATYGDPVSTWNYINDNFDTNFADYWANLLLGKANAAPAYTSGSESAIDPQNGAIGANKYLTYLTTQFDTDIANLINIYGVGAARGFAALMQKGGGTVVMHGGMVEGDYIDHTKWMATGLDYNTCYKNYIKENKLVPITVLAEQAAFRAYAEPLIYEEFNVTANGTQVEVPAIAVLDDATNTTVYVKNIHNLEKIYKAAGVTVSEYAGVTCYSNSAEGDAANKAVLEATVAKIAADKAAAEKAELEALSAIIASGKPPIYPADKSHLENATAYETVLVNGKQVALSFIEWISCYPPLTSFWGPVDEWADRYYKLTDLCEPLGFQVGWDQGDGVIIFDSAHTGPLRVPGEMVNIVNNYVNSVNEFRLVLGQGKFDMQKGSIIQALTVTVNGQPFIWEVCNNKSTVYCKLRDVGNAMGFTVTRDLEEGVAVSNGKSLPASAQIADITSNPMEVVVNTDWIVANGTRVRVHIQPVRDSDGNVTKYFKLRDIATIMGFNVDWSAATGITLSN